MLCLKPPRLCSRCLNFQPELSRRLTLDQRTGRGDPSSTDNKHDGIFSSSLFAAVFHSSPSSSSLRTERCGFRWRSLCLATWLWAAITRATMTGPAQDGGGPRGTPALLTSRSTTCPSTTSSRRGPAANWAAAAALSVTLTFIHVTEHLNHSIKLPTVFPTAESSCGSELEAHWLIYALLSVTLLRFHPYFWTFSWILTDGAAAAVMWGSAAESSSWTRPELLNIICMTQHEIWQEEKQQQ